LQKALDVLTGAPDGKFFAMFSPLFSFNARFIRILSQISSGIIAYSIESSLLKKLRMGLTKLNDWEK
jgi:hypothetical protein